VLGIAYVLETYGLIYNKTILDRYFKLENAKIKSMDEVNGFDSFKRLAEDLQANKKTLGIEGAFTSAGMDSSSDWRFKTHLANLPIYYEYEQEEIDRSPAIKGTYLKEYRQIWDLYLNNSTCAPGEIGAKTGDEAASEFNTGKAVFYQNGTWAWNEEMERAIGAENVGMIPIYIGVDGEEDQGLCTGSENYWCVNKNARKEDIQATLDFLNWVVTSETGTTALAEEMGFVSPFKAAKKSSNPLIKAADALLASGKEPVSWNFSTIPSDQWKDAVGAALLAYAQGGQTDALWKQVESAFVDGWKKEYDAAH
jgi:raffinose/stachyose/melibiose transport system substrate-binding protein